MNTAVHFSAATDEWATPLKFGGAKTSAPFPSLLAILSPMTDLHPMTVFTLWYWACVPAVIATVLIITEIRSRKK